jgi:cysteinyl-tRNA synthetase
VRIPDKATGLAALQTELFLPVVAALCEDLNTAKAFGALNSALHLFKGMRPDEQVQARSDLIQILRLLGLPEKCQTDAAVTVPAAIQALAEQRQAARLAKDWAQADAARASIKAQGWEVSDTASGFKLSPIGGNN